MNKLDKSRQHIKATAFNKIRKLYHPLHNHGYTFYEDEGSLAEQRDNEIMWIIEQMNRDLNKLKQQNKQINETKSNT